MLMKQDFNLMLSYYLCQVSVLVLVLSVLCKSWNQLWIQQRLIILGKMKKPWSQILPSDIHWLDPYEPCCWRRCVQYQMKSPIKRLNKVLGGLQVALLILLQSNISSLLKMMKCIHLWQSLPWIKRLMIFRLVIYQISIPYLRLDRWE